MFFLGSFLGGGVFSLTENKKRISFESQLKIVLTAHCFFPVKVNAEIKKEEN